MRHLFNVIALSLLFGSNAMMAQEVTVDVAKSRTLDFLSRQSIGPKFANGTTSSTDLNLAYTSKSEAKTCFYVFNIGDDNGFVIAGGDEAALEILGYCDHGSFDYDTANPAFKWWLDQYTEQISHADVSTSSPRKAKAQTAERNSIGPLLETTWDQDAPYNCMIPVYDSKNRPYYTGCVATAMAQIMNYWKYPEHGIGSHYYSGSEGGFSADFEHTWYDWNNMLTSYDGDYSPVQAEAVGTLMYHAGVAANMSYGIDGSFSVGKYYGPGFVGYFNYDASVHAEYRGSYTEEAWDELVYNELAALRPIFYTGGGHAFVCDGYDSENNEFHINWGWGGRHDGFYSLSGGNYSSYLQNNNTSTIFINVMPADDVPDVEVLHIAQAFNPLSVTIGDQSYYESTEQSGEETSEEICEYNRQDAGYLDCFLYSTLRNMSCFTSNFDLGVKAIDANTGNTYYSLSMSNKFLEIISMTKTMGLQFYPYNWEEGTYQLIPVFRKHGQTSDDDWKEIELMPTQVIPTITLTGEVSKKGCVFAFTSQPQGVNGNNFYKDDVWVYATVKNMVPGRASGNIYYYVDSRSYGYQSMGFATSGSMEVEMSVDVYPNLVPGRRYTIYFFKDKEFKHPYNYPSLEFTYRAKQEVDYSVSPAGYGTLILPFNYEKPESMTLYKCESVAGNVLYLKEETEDVICRNTPYIVLANAWEEFHFEGPKAIDNWAPTFTEGLLVGAVTDNVPLQKGTDYIMQCRDDEAAFYKYTGIESEEASENDADGNRLARQFRAFLRLPNDPSSQAPKINFPGNGDDETEGISTLSTDTLPAGIYSIDGHRQSTLQKGLNILILDDGTTQKVFVK